MPISEKLISDLISSSNFILYAIALLVFFKAISPVYKEFFKFYNSLIFGNKTKLDDTLKAQLKGFCISFLTSSQEMTAKVSDFIDKLYQFKITNQERRRDYLQFIPFLISWQLSYIYLSLFLLIVGYSTMSEALIWQFAFLVIYFSLILLYLYYKSLSLSLLIGGVFLGGVFLVGVVGVVVVGGVGVGGVGGVGVVIVGGVGGVVGVLGVVGVVCVLFTFILYKIHQSHFTLENSNIFDFLNTISTYSDKNILDVLFLFFILFPLLNALLDWLSISVTRYEFHKLTKSSKSYFSYFRIIVWDLFLAFGFKLLVLLLLYANAHLWEGNPAVFEVEVLREYWRHLLDVYLFRDIDMSYFYSTQNIQLISLMIMTTLIPSVAHLLIVIIHLVYKILSEILGLLSHLFIGNGRFFSFVMSFISVGILWFIISYSFNPKETISKENNVSKGLR